MKFEYLASIILSITTILIVSICVYLVLAEIGKTCDILPPPNSTAEWKEILSKDSTCNWYNLGCQKYACVIDCEEINKNAGEIICVC